MEKVGRTVIVLDLASSLSINVKAEAFCAVCRDTLSNVDCKVVLLDSVDDIDPLAALGKNIAGISYLSSISA